jgi:hypothetical protein
MKALGIAAATVVAFAPLSMAVATSPDVARAAPCVGAFANPASCENCLHLVEVYHTANVCEKPAPRPAQAAPSSAPVQIPEAPPEPPLPEPAMQEPPMQEPAPPSVMPVQSPTPPIVPPPSTIAVAAHKEPSQPAEPWWPVALGYGGLALAVGVVSWMISRRNGVRS